MDANKNLPHAKAVMIFKLENQIFIVCSEDNDCMIQSGPISTQVELDPRVEQAEKRRAETLDKWHLVGFASIYTFMNMYGWEVMS